MVHFVDAAIAGAAVVDAWHSLGAAFFALSVSEIDGFWVSNLLHDFLIATSDSFPLGFVFTV